MIFTSLMYERLSEWLSNLSLLFIGTLVVPFFFGRKIDLSSLFEVLFGLGLAIGFLWLSLRMARIAERRR